MKNQKQFELFDDYILKKIIKKWENQCIEVGCDECPHGEANANICKMSVIYELCRRLQNAEELNNEHTKS